MEINLNKPFTLSSRNRLAIHHICFIGYLEYFLSFARQNYIQAGPHRRGFFNQFEPFSGWENLALFREDRGVVDYNDAGWIRRFRDAVGRHFQALENKLSQKLRDYFHNLEENLAGLHHPFGAEPEYWELLFHALAAFFRLNLSGQNNQRAFLEPVVEKLLADSEKRDHRDIVGRIVFGQVAGLQPTGRQRVSLVPAKSFRLRGEDCFHPRLAIRDKELWFMGEDDSGHPAQIKVTDCFYLENEYLWEMAQWANQFAPAEPAEA